MSGPATPVDWHALRQRVAAAESAIAARPTPPETRAGILKARAKALAAEKPQHAAEEAGPLILEFVMAHETYAVEARFVEAVAPLTALTPIPCTPPFVLGVLPLRGKIISLIDLKKFFGLPDKGLAERNRVILLRSERLEIGVLADAVRGVRHAEMQQTGADLPTLTGLRRQYMRGLTSDGAIILDTEAILADPQIRVNENSALSA